jgi:hypothetical protein
MCPLVLHCYESYGAERAGLRSDHTLGTRARTRIVGRFLKWFPFLTICIEFWGECVQNLGRKVVNCKLISNGPQFRAVPTDGTMAV